MATTPNLGLTKDGEGDLYSLARVNANSDRIDTFAGEALTDTVYDTTGTPALIKKRKIAGVVTPVTIETPDTTPTEGSKHLITSDAVHAALTAKADASRLTADEAALAEVINSGAKNVFYYTKVGTSSQSGSQHLSNGVRFSIQADGSILVNRESAGTNEAYCNLRLDSSAQNIDDFCNGQYVLSGSYGDCILRATNNTYNAIDTDGNGVVLQDRGAQTGIWVQLRVPMSASPDNVLVKPMICTKPEWDASHTYEPYALSNPVITSALIEQVDNGAKNRAKDQTAASTWINIATDTLPEGEYVVFFGTLTSTDTDATTCAVRLGLIGSGFSSSTVQCDRGNSVYVGITADSTFDYIRIYYSDTNAHSSGDSATITNPMICTKNAWDASHAYEPYCPSMQELYQMILALQNGTRSALATSAAPEEVRTEPETGGEGEQR